MIASIDKLMTSSDVAVTFLDEKALPTPGSSSLGKFNPADLSFITVKDKEEFVLSHKVHGEIIKITVKIDGENVNYENFPTALEELLTAYTKT